MKKSKPEEGFRLPFEVDSQDSVKPRDRSLKGSAMLESFFALGVCGGDRCEDFRNLREDAALVKPIGHEFPAANTARHCLSLFHEDDLPFVALGGAGIGGGGRVSGRERDGELREYSGVGAGGVPFAVWSGADLPSSGYGVAVEQGVFFCKAREIGCAIGADLSAGS